MACKAIDRRTHSSTVDGAITIHLRVSRDDGSADKARPITHDCKVFDGTRSTLPAAAPLRATVPTPAPQPHLSPSTPRRHATVAAGVP
jgi:hypothetical protein